MRQLVSGSAEKARQEEWARERSGGCPEDRTHWPTVELLLILRDISVPKAVSHLVLD